MKELRLAKCETYSTEEMYPSVQPPKRNLGSAIIVAAIEDYLSTNERVHKSAAEFLYPVSVEHQRHYEWAVALASGVNPVWLRESLDRARSQWDRRRSVRIASRIAKRVKSTKWQQTPAWAAPATAMPAANEIASPQEFLVNLLEENAEFQSL